MQTRESNHLVYLKNKIMCFTLINYSYIDKTKVIITVNRQSSNSKLHLSPTTNKKIKCSPSTSQKKKIVTIKFSKDDEADKVEEHQFKSLIGCLIFLTATRPDIMFAISMLLRFMHYASEVHLQAVKQIVRYVKGTVDYGVKYTHSQNFQFHGYSDSD